MNKEEAIKFLRSEGYCVMERKPYCYWTVLDVLYMLKQMQTPDGSSSHHLNFTDTKYSEEFAEAVMDMVERRFDADSGMSWYNIQSAIEEIVEEEKN